MEEDNGTPLRGRAVAADAAEPVVSPLRASIPSAVKLSAIENETLSAWRDCSEGYGFSFKRAATRCATPPHQIRRAVRSLARKGLLSYERTLFDEGDGEMLGAGYVLTSQGWEAVRDR